MAAACTRVRAMVGNRKAVQGVGETRYQRYLRKVPDLSAPIVFGTTVSIVEDVRGHGRLNGSIGRLVGVDGSSTLCTGRSEVGSSARVTSSRSTSSPSSTATSPPPSPQLSAGRKRSSAAPKPPAPKPAAPARAAPPVIDVPLQTRIEVLWPDKSGANPVWYAGKIVDWDDQRNGIRRHTVEYDGWTEQQWCHNLASDDFKWRYLHTSPPAAERSTRGPVTRSRTVANASLAIEFVEAALECTREHLACDAFNAAAYQALGDEADLFECTSADNLDACRAALATAAAATDLAVCSSSTIPIWTLVRGDYECAKATQDVIDVQTPTGPQQYKVPSTLRQVELSEQRDQWLAADQKALDAILAWPGNKLVSTAVPQRLGVPIAPCVTQRKIKIDPATRALTCEMLSSPAIVSTAAASMRSFNASSSRTILTLPPPSPAICS